MSIFELRNVSTEDMLAEIKRRREIANGVRCPTCEGKVNERRQVSDGWTMNQCDDNFHINSK